MNDAAPERNYTTISPSALSLLLMKGHTGIPYAREAAAVMSQPGEYKPNFENREAGYWARVLHFESRYWSIDQLLADIDTKNILEISSGYSLRGLAMAQAGACHYIDTDLPGIIDAKQRFTAQIQGNTVNKGLLETLPLNALDASEFNEIINRFDKGIITIVNEGLLMYLGIDEKKQLCRNIHSVLKQCGGYWITADIYIRQEGLGVDLKMNAQQKAFFEQHKIEENKFDSFETAEAFFQEQGFVIDKVAVPDHARLSSLQYLLASLPEDKRTAMGSTPKMHATWRLRAV